MFVFKLTLQGVRTRLFTSDKPGQLPFSSGFSTELFKRKTTLRLSRDFVKVVREYKFENIVILSGEQGRIPKDLVLSYFYTQY